MKLETNPSRRKAILGFLCALIGLSTKLEAKPSESQHRRVQWKKLHDEPVRIGDMWASHDPNTPEKQAGQDYNLQMQAIHTSYYGTPAKNIGLGNGAHWRPIAIVEVTA